MYWSIIAKSTSSLTREAGMVICTEKSVLKLSFSFHWHSRTIYFHLSHTLMILIDENFKIETKTRAIAKKSITTLIRTRVRIEEWSSFIAPRLTKKSKSSQPKLGMGKFILHCQMPLPHDASNKFTTFKVYDSQPVMSSLLNCRHIV